MKEQRFFLQIIFKFIFLENMQNIFMTLKSWMWNSMGSAKELSCSFSLSKKSRENIDSCRYSKKPKENEHFHSQYSDLISDDSIFEPKTRKSIVDDEGSKRYSFFSFFSTNHNIDTTDQK